MDFDFLQLRPRELEIGAVQHAATWPPRPSRPVFANSTAERRQNQIVLASLAVVFLWVALATYADIRFTAAPSFTSADFLAGSLCYALTGFLAVIAFHRQQWGWVIIVWNCASFGLAMLLSVALFREPFTLKRAAASLLALLAILLAA